MTRKINFFDGAQSGTTPTTGNVTASNLIQYANDAAYEAAESGAPATGNIYYNTTDNVIRYYNGTNWETVISEDGVATLTNKTIDADSNTITNIDNDEIKPGAAIDATKLADGSVSNTELQHINSLTSNAQDQIDTAQATADANTTDIADLRTTTGTSDGDTDMGTFSGSIISDNVSTKVGMQELETAIEGLTSGLEFQGTWNADTNTPTLTSSTGTKNFYYAVSVAGTTNLDGETDWNVGDWAIYNGTVWQRIDNSETVTSVNSQTGNVVLDTDDIAEGVTNEYYTNAKADGRIAAASIDDLSDVDTTTDAPLNGEALTWDGSNWVPGEGGGGSGLKNFLNTVNSRAEGISDILDSGWATFDDGAVDIPIDGTAGSPTAITFDLTSVSGEIQEGEQSYIVEKSAADAQGEGVSVQLENVDLAFQEDILYGSFYYDTTSANYAGTWGVWIYDIDNTSLINILEGDNLIPQGKGKFNFSFVAPDNAPNVSQLRLILMETDTNTDAYDIIFDLVKVGPDSLKVDLPIARGETIDVAGSGDFTAGSIRVERINNTVTVSTVTSLTYTSNSNPASAAGLLPEWARPALVKSATARTSSLTYSFWCQPDGTIEVETRDSSFALSATTSDFGHSTISYTVEEDGQSIEGLVRNSRLANVQANATVGQTLANSTSTLINFDTIDSNVGALYNESTDRFVADRAMTAYVSTALAFDTNATGYRQVAVRVNGADVIQSSALGTTATSTVGPDVSGVLNLQKDDYIEVYAFQNSGGNLSLTTSSERNYLHIQEIPFTNTAISGGLTLIGEEVWTDSQTNATTRVKLWRNGSKLKGIGQVDYTGAHVAASYDLTIPSQYTAKTDFYTVALSALKNSIGQASLYDQSANQVYDGSVSLNAANEIRIYAHNATSNATYKEILTAGGPFSWASGDVITFDFEYEVEGW